MWEILKKLLHGDEQAAVLARGSAAGMAVQIAGALLGLLAQIALTRIMNQAGYGTYSYVLAWIYTLTVLTLFGFDSGLVRFIAQYLSAGEFGLVRGLYRFVIKFGIAASLVIGLLVMSLIYIGLGNASPQLRLTFWVAVVLLPLLTVIRMNEAFMRGCKRIIWANLGTSILRPAMLAVMIALLLVAGHKLLAPSQAMALTLVAALISLAITSYKARRTVSGVSVGLAVESRPSQWFSVSVPLLLMASIGTVLNKADILILGGLDSAAHVGIYNVVSKISGLLLYGLNAVNMIAAPMIAEMYARGRRDQLQRIVALASIGIFTFVFLGSILMAVFGKWVLAIFGGAYVEGYHALLILLVGQGVNALCGPVGYLLSMTGRQTIAMKVLFVAALVNVVLNFVLIPLLGYVGAALATTCAMILWNFALLVIVRRQMGIDPTIFGLLRTSIS